MAFQTAAGASLAVIATAPATFDAAGYGALTLTNVGEVENIGSFGKEFELVTWNPLATRGTKKAKGSWNNGSLTPRVALDPDDAGQVLMEAALESDDPYYFLITLQDGTEYYFAGVVMNFRPNVGSVNDVVMADTTIEITDSPIVKVAAA